MIGLAWEESVYRLEVTEDGDTNTIEEGESYKDISHEYLYAVNYFQHDDSDYPVKIVMYELVYHCTTPTDDDNNHKELVTTKVLESWERL